MKLINIGFGNMVSANRLIAIVSPESAPIKRIIQDSRDRGTLIDATYGRRTRAVLITDSDHVILSAVQPETVANRVVDYEDEEETEYDEHVWLSLRNAETLTQTIADALCERMLPTRLSIRKTQQTILPSCLNWTTNIRMLLQTLNAQRFCSPTAWSSAIFLNRNCFRLLQISSDCFTMYSGNISSRGGTLSGFLIFILPPRGNFLILWGCLLSDWMSL